MSENPRHFSEADCLAVLKRNGVRIVEKHGKYPDETGVRPVVRRDIEPSAPMGLKLIRMVDCLMNHYPKRKYWYSYSAG